MLRFGTTVIGSVLTFVALVMLIAGSHVAYAEGRPGAAALGAVIAAGIGSVAALVSGLGATLHRLEMAMARLERALPQGPDEA
ncbi:MAG: hypothetical protein U0166_00745 [Acidobacteriota bacterium]